MTRNSARAAQGDISVTLHGAIAEIPPADWDACAGPGNPFVSHAFLSALELSGSTGPATGWLPRHAALRDAGGRLLAVVPMYGKSHSYGEYVFDHGWARAYAQAGGRYYPKLQVAVPFSPVPGPRLLIHPGSGLDVAGVAAALAHVCGELGMSSVHVTFCTEAEYAGLGRAGWLQRLGVQFHWHNKGYTDFDGFLAELSASRRKTIRRERRDVAASGLEFATLQGAAITPAHWDAFYQFYQSTVDRKWGSAYLSAAFFPLLGQMLGDRVVLMLALRDGKPVAGALNLLGDDTLYGRNWGAVVDVPFLHFELCYYMAVDFAIRHGLARVEAGAQGEHKVHRGYLPVLTYSGHWIAHNGLRRAVADFLEQERVGIMGELEILSEALPFKESK